MSLLNFGFLFHLSITIRTVRRISNPTANRTAETGADE